MLDIPSIQLEIPRKMRKYLFENDDVSFKFNEILITAFEKIISKWDIKINQIFANIS